MCGQCEGLSERRNFLLLEEFHEYIQQLDTLVKHHILVLAPGSDPWPEMVWQASGNPIREFLGDVVTFDFACSLCASTFHLRADLYHGGARWTPSHASSRRS